MRRVFADTSFYLALANPKDNWHEAAHSFAQAYRDEVVTSEYVVVELGSLMSRNPLRSIFLELVESIGSDSRTAVLAASTEVFNASMDLFRRRRDKEWSLTDCTSFVFMERHGLKEALTSDRHFDQAGFQSILG